MRSTIVLVSTRSSVPLSVHLDLTMCLLIGNSVTSTANASPTNSQPKLAIAPDRSGIDPSGFSSQAPLYELHDPVLGPGSDMAAVSAALPARHSRQPSGDLSFADSSVFFPMDAMGNVGSFFGDGESIEEDDDDDDALLNIHDFIDFGDDSSEDGDRTAGDDSAITSPVTAEGPGPVQPKTPSSDASNDLMKHFDRHLVSAFRRGQPHQQSQARPRHGNLSLNSYALKGGRQATANAPLGPQKKRKLSGSFNNRPSFGVPATKKRMMNHR